MNIEAKNLNVRDPFIYVEDGVYYLFGTFPIIRNKLGHRRLYAYKSLDLKNFDGPHYLFDCDEGFWGEQYLWAPEVHKYIDRYYMFVTFKGHGMLGTQILVSESIFGKYTPLTNDPITPKDWHCIDGSLFVEDNIPYLVFVRSWSEVRNGHMCIARLNDDLTKLIEEPKTLFKARDASWVTAVKEYGDGGVTDGPYIFKKSGIYHMLWSSYRNDSYALSIALSTKLYSGWQQEQEPFLSDDIGHGMIFVDKNKVFLSVHSPNKPFGQELERLRLIEFDAWSDKYEIIAAKNFKK